MFEALGLARTVFVDAASVHGFNSHGLNNHFSTDTDPYFPSVISVIVFVMDVRPET